MALTDRQREELRKQRRRKPSPPRPLFPYQRESFDKMRDRITRENVMEVLTVETIITDFDRETPTTDEVCLRALALARGEQAVLSPDAEAIAQRLEAAREARAVPREVWRGVLEVIRASVMTRTSDTPGSRGYLDYVHSFLTHELKGRRPPMI